jgi:hypothetical protein
MSSAVQQRNPAPVGLTANTDQAGSESESLATQFASVTDANVTS